MSIPVQGSSNDALGVAESAPRLLTVPEVAEVLGVCTATVYRAIWSGKLPSVRIGRAVRVRIDQLRSYVDGLG